VTCLDPVTVLPPPRTVWLLIRHDAREQAKAPPVSVNVPKPRVLYAHGGSV
jgi:hypothetical protein